MTLHGLACAYAERLTAFNRAPITILLFAPISLAFIAAGWATGRASLFLLILTTALSIDASLTARMTQLKQGQEAGEV
ncbi:MAG: hypothetical protein ACOYBT_09860 [Polynucleobacter sp.]